MAQSFINNGESGLSVRNKLNDRWQVLAQSSVAVVCPADTNEDALATITVPANSMGPNGRLRVTAIWSCTNNANVKTVRVRFNGASGTQYGALSLANNASAHEQREICNRNSASSQVGGAQGATGGWGATSGAVSTSSADTTADTTIVLTAQKATAGDTLTLESYLVELLYAA